MALTKSELEERSLPLAAQRRLRGFERHVTINRPSRGWGVPAYSVGISLREKNPLAEREVYHAQPPVAVAAVVAGGSLCR